MLIVFSVIFFIKKRDKNSINTFLISLLTVGIGESLNALSSTTVYHTALLMIPQTKIPLFILPAGAIISAWTFWISVKTERLSGIKYARFISFIALAIVIPLLSEFIGVKLRIWRWNIPVEFSLFFVAGIWKFYFLFIFSPVLFFLSLAKTSDCKRNTT